LSGPAFELINDAMKLAKKDAPQTLYLFPGWTGRKDHGRGQYPLVKQLLTML